MSIRDLMLATRGKARIEKVQGLDESLGTVFVKGLTVNQRDAFEEACMAKSNKRIRVLLLTMAVCEEDGKNVFTTADAASIGAMPVDLITPIFDKACELSGLMTQDVKALEGNLPESRNGDSDSGLPLPSDAQSAG